MTVTLPSQPAPTKQVGLGGQRRRSRRASSFIDRPPPPDGRRAGSTRRRVAGARKRGTTVTFGSAKWELVVQACNRRVTAV